jgi:hypothetical protein
MRKTVLTLSALAAAVIFASAGNRAEASPLGNPGALNGAVDELAVIDSVHCRPGWRHHNPNRWRRADGCSREYRRGVVVVPGRTRYIWRDGVRVRVGGGGERSRTTVRSRTDVNVRTRGGRDGDGGGDRVRTRSGGDGDKGGRARQRGGDGDGGARKGGGGAQKGGGEGGGGGSQ